MESENSIFIIKILFVVSIVMIISIAGIAEFLFVYYDFGHLENLYKILISIGIFIFSVISIIVLSILTYLIVRKIKIRESPERFTADYDKTLKGRGGSRFIDRERAIAEAKDEAKLITSFDCVFNTNIELNGNYSREENNIPQEIFIEKCIFNYKNKLGEGTYGSVHSYVNYANEQDEIAVKFFIGSNAYVEFQNEADIIKSLGNDCNLINSRILHLNSGRIESIVMKKMDGSLYGLITRLNRKQLSKLFDFMKHSIIECMQKKGYYYLDLKLNNILYKINDTGDYDFILGDIGSIMTHEKWDGQAIITYPSLYTRKLEDDYVRDLIPSLHDLRYGIGMIMLMISDCCSTDKYDYGAVNVNKLKQDIEKDIEKFKSKVDDNIYQQVKEFITIFSPYDKMTTKAAKATELKQKLSSLTSEFRTVSNTERALMKRYEKKSEEMRDEIKKTLRRLFDIAVGLKAIAMDACHLSSTDSLARDTNDHATNAGSEVKYLFGFFGTPLTHEQLDQIYF